MYSVEQLKKLFKDFGGFETGMRLIIYDHNNKFDDYQLVKVDKNGLVVVKSTGSEAGVLTYVYNTSIKRALVLDCKIPKDTMVENEI